MRIAVIGAGWAGQRQVEAIRELETDVAVAALVDNDAAFLKETADRLGIADRHTDYRTVLKDPSIDAVSVCTPHALHAGIALDAAAAGKHVLCEKPLALTVDEGREMVRAAHEHGVKLYVAESAAYSDEALRLRALMACDSPIGDLVFAKLFRGFRTTHYGYAGRRAWLGRPELGGTGTWMLHGIHLVGHARFILGEVRSIYMVEQRTEALGNRDVEGTVCAMMVMASSAPLLVVQSCENDMPGTTGGWTLHGNRGTLRSSRNGIEWFNDSGSTDSAAGGSTSAFALPELPDSCSPYAREIMAFARYVRGSDEPTDGASELRSLAVVEAGYQSMRTGKPVVLAEHYPDLFR